jgi:SAM-dependent methyltransferase
VDVKEPKQSVAGLFGRAAVGYDQVGFFHQVAQRLLALAGVGQGMRVLDVACGTGAILVQAARLAGPAGLAVGVDLAEPMAAVGTLVPRSWRACCGRPAEARCGCRWSGWMWPTPTRRPGGPNSGPMANGDR